jgi:hypothetical protein
MMTLALKSRAALDQAALRAYGGRRGFVDRNRAPLP